MTSRVAAVVLVIVGLVATAAGLGLRVFLPDDDDGHHDGRTPTFAMSSTAGADELLVSQDGGGPTISVSIERAGQPITDFDDVHDAPMHVYAASTDLDWFIHLDPAIGADGSSEAFTLGSDGAHRVVTQSAPSGGPDLLELGADVTVTGAPDRAEQNITDDDRWTEGDLTITRQGFDFVLSRPFDGDDYHGDPALLTLFRGDDMAFSHGHAALVEPDRFRFELALPGRGEYLAALQFLATPDASEPTTALFRFTL